MAIGELFRAVFSSLSCISQSTEEAELLVDDLSLPSESTKILKS